MTYIGILQASVPIMSNAKCQDMFLKGGRKEHIPEIFLCAGYEKGGRDSCQVRFILPFISALDNPRIWKNCKLVGKDIFHPLFFSLLKKNLKTEV